MSSVGERVGATEQSPGAEGGRPAAPRRARWLMRGGLAGFLILSSVLGLASELDLLDALYLGALLTILPAMGVAQALVMNVDHLDRLAVYGSSGVAILVLGGLGAILGLRRTTLEEFGLVVNSVSGTVMWTLGLIAVFFVIVMVFNGLQRTTGRPTDSVMAALLPRSRTEKWAFVGLSLAAGLGEELAYRAYLITTLYVAVPSFWFVALTSSLAFGMLHAYQGLAGIAAVTLVGFILAASFLLSGSLIPAMISHATLDVMVGLFLGEMLLDE